jgi:hypothetical protein
MRKITAYLFATYFLTLFAHAAVRITPASGGTALLSDYAANSVSPVWTTLGPITIQERKKSDIGAGAGLTLVLKAPAGFEFNPAVNPNVSFTNGRDISAASASVVNSTTLRITFSVSGTGGLDTLTIGSTQGLQVRPTLTSPAARGSILRPAGATGGTAILSGVKNDGKGGATVFASLVEVAGVASKLGIGVEPSTNALTGVKFGRQPVIRVLDSAGNLRQTDNGRTITAAVYSGGGSLSGTVTAVTVNGLATYTNLALSNPGVITLVFSTAGLTSVVSAPVVVVESGPPSVPTSLSVKVQPSLLNTAGVAFATQPVISVLDQFDFPMTNQSGVVTAALLNDSGVLKGTLTANLVKGVATFTNLAYTNATDISIQFTSGVLNSATSQVITITPAPASRLVFDVEPDLAGIGREFGVQPVVSTEDAFGNTSVSGLGASLDVIMTLSSGTGSLSGTTVLDIGTNDGNGVVMFTDLSINTLGDKRLTASASGMTSAVSAIFTVLPKTNQTITAFADIASKNYGDASFVISASASSGLPVSFSIVSGNATVVSNVVTITGSGTVTVRASQLGNQDYFPAQSIDQDFDVARAPLVITANNAARNYGEANPTFSGTVVGLTNGDSMTVSFETAATAQASPGTYAITAIVSDPDGRLGNYDVTFVSGSLTIASVPPVIVNQPVNHTVGLNFPVTFTVGANGPLLRYQWRFEGNILIGATNRDMVIDHVLSSDEGNYSVDVINDSGSVGSSNATLTVVIPPGISSQPTTAQSALGLNFILPVSAGAGFVVTGTQPFSYQWQKNGTPLASQTTSALKLSSVKTTNTGYYTVILSNLAGSISSAPIRFVAGPVVAPKIVTQPTNQETVLNDAVTFSVVATGNPLDYQWRFNGAAIAGATESSYVLSAGQFSDNGAYSVVVSNSAGSVLSSNATLEVSYDPNTISNDVDLDGHTDVLVQSTNNYFGVWNIDGTNLFDTFLLNNGAPLTAGWRAVGHGDFNKDRQMDYVFQNKGFVRIWLMNGTNMTSSVPVNIKSLVGGWKVAGASDFNRDGKTDLILRDYLGRTAIWIMNGTKVKKSVLVRGGFATPAGWQLIGLDDFNKDGNVDILWEQVKTGKLHIWFMNRAQFKRSAFFRAAPTPFASWRVPGVIDLDKTASRDVLWKNTNGSLFSWSMNGTNVIGTNYLNLAVPGGWSIVGER